MFCALPCGWFSLCLRVSVVNALGLLSCCHALHASLPVERHSWAPPDSVAQPVSFVENRDLYRCEDAPDRSAGILGIYLAGAPQPLALSEVDWRDGTLRPPLA